MVGVCGFGADFVGVLAAAEVAGMTGRLGFGGGTDAVLCSFSILTGGGALSVSTSEARSADTVPAGHEWI